MQIYLTKFETIKFWLSVGSDSRREFQLQDPSRWAGKYLKPVVRS